MNRITTKPQRTTVLRTAAVACAVVLGLTATACGGNEDSSKVAEASVPAVTESGPGATGSATTTPSSGEPEADASASRSGSSATTPGPSDSTGTGSSGARPLVLDQKEEDPKAEDADRRPGKLVLSEHTTVSRISWKRWSDTEATGTGEVTGTWCLETCQDKPLTGTVTLSEPKTVDGKRYFSAYTLKLADGTATTYTGEDLNGKRSLPTP